MKREIRWQYLVISLTSLACLTCMTSCDEEGDDGLVEAALPSAVSCIKSAKHCEELSSTVSGDYAGFENSCEGTYSEESCLTTNLVGRCFMRYSNNENLLSTDVYYLTDDTTNNEIFEYEGGCVAANNLDSGTENGITTTVWAGISVAYDAGTGQAAGNLTVSCNFTEYCSQWDGLNSTDAGSVETSCTGVTATYAASACPTAGASGTCSLTFSSVSFTQKFIYYDAATAQYQQEGCQSMTGISTPLLGDVTATWSN